VELELSADQTDTLAALEEALQRLERIAERQSRVVECRFFGGMSVEDTAAALGMSERSVKRDWSFARAWLRREMQITLGGAD
jgi:RNA polymerase sigma factor (sigma-70 family)